MPTTPKIKWTVGPAPTGQFRSFHKRGWPSADIKEHTVALLRCKDEYVPSRVKTGDHAPIEIIIWVRSKGHKVPEQKRMKQRASSLAQAKLMVDALFKKSPELLGDLQDG